MSGLSRGLIVVRLEPDLADAEKYAEFNDYYQRLLLNRTVLEHRKHA